MCAYVSFQIIIVMIDRAEKINKLDFVFQKTQHIYSLSFLDWLKSNVQINFKDEDLYPLTYYCSEKQ